MDVPPSPPVSSPLFAAPAAKSPGAFRGYRMNLLSLTDNLFLARFTPGGDGEPGQGQRARAWVGGPLQHRHQQAGPLV